LVKSDYIFATYLVSGDDISANEVEMLALKRVNNAGVGISTGIDFDKYGLSWEIPSIQLERSITAKPHLRAACGCCADGFRWTLTAR
jgi:hypothetical protein